MGLSLGWKCSHVPNLLPLTQPYSYFINGKTEAQRGQVHVACLGSTVSGIQSQKTFNQLGHGTVFLLCLPCHPGNLTHRPSAVFFSLALPHLSICRR